MSVSSRPSFSRLSVWLRLLRAPNLVTVPGDPLAGFLIASGASVVPGVSALLAILVSVLAYAAGTIMNDLVDLREDREDRPFRPLPAGAVDAALARTIVLCLFVVAILLAKIAGLAVLLAALALILVVILYNAALKATPVGPIAMGACRAASVLLGAAAAAPLHPGAWAAAGAIGAYVAALSVAARRELGDPAPLWRTGLPAAVVLVIAVACFRYAPVDESSMGRAGGALFAAFSIAGLAAWRWSGGAAGGGPAAVGLMVSALIPLQAALCIASGGGPMAIGAGFALLVLWPVNRGLAMKVRAD